MFKTCLFSFLLLLAVIEPAAAGDRTPFQARCEDELRKPSFVLTAQQIDYAVDHTVSSRILNAMSLHIYIGDRMLGLTEIRTSVEISFDGPVMPDPASGYECLSPQIEIALRYSPIKVYIAREFPRVSCSYKEILAHEMRHVQIYQQNLPKIEVLVREALVKRFASPIFYAMSGQSKLVLENEINTLWRPFISAQLAKVEALQAALDSKEEAYRMSNACHGEVASILARYF